MVPKILFYSYKGGTGRSSAAANIATQLAIMGRRILVVDLDIEGPSLNIVFDLPEDEIGKDLYVQDYLRSPDADSWPSGRAILNMKNYLSEKGKLEDEMGGELFFLPASESYEKTVHFHGDTVQMKLDRLFEKLEYENSLDAILLDCPNGYGPMTQRAFFLADLILMFFKWSKQHIIGSGKISEVMRYLDIEYWPIPCIVPWSEARIFPIYKDRLQKRLKRDTLVHVIHENEDFKWEEQVVMSAKEKFGKQGTNPERNKRLIEEFQMLSSALNNYLQKFVSRP